MCPCKRATGPAALQSRHLPRVEGVGFTGRKQATIRGVGFHFPRAFFFALLPLLPRFTRVCRCARVFSFVFVSSPLSLSLSRPSTPVRHVGGRALFRALPPVCWSRGPPCKL